MFGGQYSAYDLFCTFQPRFSKVVWKPAGFPMREDSSKLHFNLDRIGHTYTYFPYIDIDMADVAFAFEYDPAGKHDPTTQLVNACWEAILAGPFAGRVFRMKPSWEAMQTAFAARAAGELLGGIPIIFSYEGENIPGLHFVNDMKAPDWSFFIPSDSAEGKVIVTAIELEQARYRRQRHQEEGLTEEHLYELSRQLEGSLAAVTA